MRYNRALLFGLLFVASSVTSCSSGGKDDPADAGEPYGPCVPFVSEAGLDGSTSFATVVAPIFQANCTSGGINCHGTPQNVPYLGAYDGGAEIETMLSSIKGVISPEDPAMDLVAPGDPGHSYLMHKLDGDECTLAADCMTSRFKDYLGNCGNNMPNGAAMLPLAVRDQVRAWIAQGAQDN